MQTCEKLVGIEVKGGNEILTKSNWETNRTVRNVRGITIAQHFTRVR